MASFMASVSQDFDVQNLADELVQNYAARGYVARAIKMKNGARVTIEKGRGGINTILGLSEGVTVTLNKQGAETLVANFGDADWVSKIIGFAVGLICCIPFITALVGTVRQLSLPKSIENDIAAMVSE